MSTVRQDAWSSDEDLILAEVVLRHIREGSTQLAAFEEVGQRLSRTSAACGFRWNSAIRKKYEAAITLAKKQRKKTKQPQENQEVYLTEVAAEQTIEQENVEEIQEELVEPTVEVETVSKTITMKDVIDYLTSVSGKSVEQQQLEKDNEALRNEIAQLKEKNRKIEKEIESLKKEKDIINEDYRSLIGIMDRARKMSIIVEDESKLSKSK
ncbi:RsfA family transcriptional regulator [Bacillus alkalicellulosilyticus]|uniref:RsfA family transcriptional regulator n=1 Tax=Alkalihalobacterium alkalicellulosilyticum TaxID=1912214 RepID=UPI00099882BE|nr:RsfA family transcriptional regulator [Bacillus alkalicellulosilyticus]